MGGSKWLPRTGMIFKTVITWTLLGETKEPNIFTFESEAQNLVHDVSDAALIVTNEENSS